MSKAFGESSRTILRFSGGSDLLARCVQKRTQSWTSHVDFLLPNNRILGALPHGGVQVRDLTELKDEKHFALLMVPGISDGWEYLYSQIGKPYDYSAILGLALPFPRNWQAENRWFCSEGVAASLMAKGCQIVDEDTWRVTPKDLLMSPKLMPLFHA